MEQDTEQDGNRLQNSQKINIKGVLLMKKNNILLSILMFSLLITSILFVPLYADSSENIAIQDRAVATTSAAVTNQSITAYWG